MVTNDIADASNDRVNQNSDYYRERQQIIEHQFGTLKRHWHFDYCLTRGKEKVLGETYLIFTTYNLRRLVSILGFNDTMAKIKALNLVFYHQSVVSYSTIALRLKYIIEAHQPSHRIISFIPFSTYGYYTNSR